MAKDRFEKKWKVRNVGGGETYTHEKERIEITVNADNSVTFTVKPDNENLPSWGQLEDLGGVLYDKEPGVIFGTFRYRDGLHVYWMTLEEKAGRPALTCHVDDAQPGRSGTHGAKVFQPGSWVAEDELGAVP